MDNIFVGRQPIFDRDSNLYAYELLFRDGSENAAGVVDGDQATSRVIINVFLEIGLDRIVGAQRGLHQLHAALFCRSGIAAAARRTRGAGGP